MKRGKTLLWQLGGPRFKSCPFFIFSEQGNCKKDLKYVRGSVVDTKMTQLEQGSSGYINVCQRLNEKIN